MEAEVRRPISERPRAPRNPEFWDELREHFDLERWLRGWTQAQFARESGVDEATISDWLRSKTAQPEEITITKLSQALSRVKPDPARVAVHRALHNRDLERAS